MTPERNSLLAALSVCRAAYPLLVAARDCLPVQDGWIVADAFCVVQKAGNVLQAHLDCTKAAHEQATPKKRRRA